jgi:hypothetical protein
VDFTVGRHAADDDAGVHPIVAAALQRQAPSPGVAPRHGPGPRGAALADGEGELGWPGPPADGTGLGWPADSRTDATAEAAPEPLAAVPAAPVKRRLGWRRLFGGSAPASAETPQGSSAA